jgi:hypothetical protein
MDKRYFEIETTSDSTMSVQLSETKDIEGNKVIRVCDEVCFMITDSVSYGEEIELYASLTKEEARKLALILMNMAR